MNELDMKIKITTFFLDKEDGLVNFEYPFHYNTRRCDVLFMNDNETIGVEIKSDIDKLTNLKKQLESYYYAFNTVYVACGLKHIKEVKSFKGNFGIILVSDNETKIVRMPRSKKNLEKKIILDMLDKKLLEEEVCVKGKTKELLIQYILKNKSQQEIQSLYIKVLKEKIKPIYELFLKERGNIITAEDIALLSLKSKKLTIN